VKALAVSKPQNHILMQLFNWIIVDSYAFLYCINYISTLAFCYIIFMFWK